MFEKLSFRSLAAAFAAALLAAAAHAATITHGATTIKPGAALHRRRGRSSDDPLRPHEAGRVRRPTRQRRPRSPAERQSSLASDAPSKPLQTGILLLETADGQTRSAPEDRLRQRFRASGVALTAYASGILRASLPDRSMSGRDLDILRSTLRRCT